MMAGLRRRGATAFLAKAYLYHKKEEVQESFKKRFPNPFFSSAFVGGDGTEEYDDSYDIEAQSLLSSGNNNNGGGMTNSKNNNYFNANENAMPDLKHISTFTFIVFVFAGLSLLSNLSILMKSFISFLAGMISSAISIFVFRSQVQLENMETLLKVQNEVRKDVNRLASENNELAHTREELETQSASLTQKKDALQSIASNHGQTTSMLVELVKENHRVNDSKRAIIIESIIANLMDTVIRGERDQSGNFSDNEIRRMITYMRGLPAVTVNEDLLRKAIRKDRSILSIMNLIRDLGREGVQHGDNIFIINEHSKDLQTKTRCLQL